MNEQYETHPAGSYVPPMPEKRNYAPAESAFAWLCLLGGYLLCRAMPVTDSPLGGFLMILGLFAAATVMLHLKKCTCPASAWCAAGSAVTVGAGLLLSSDPMLHRLCFWYALAAYAYFVYATAGNALRRGCSDLVLIDTFKAAVVMPFCAKANLFTAMFSGKAKSGGKVIGKLLLGLALALVPTAAVLVLLSYDSDFSALLGNLFDFDVGDIFSHLASIAFGIPIGMYLFGMMIANVDREAADLLTEEGCTHAAAKCRVISPLTVAAATLPMLVVYGIFFVSQWHYYTAGFTGVLPDGFSYATFAREGFFQLCMVSVINLAVILLAILVTKRSDTHSSWLLKILTPLYSVATLVLIATAMAKMVMYIDSYGLTQKRVYATWFMAVIAVIFILVVIGQFAPRFKTAFVCVAVVVVMFAGLVLSNVDGMIADYNTDRYLDGDLMTVDIEALKDLDEAAVPALARLYECATNRSIRNNAKVVLKFEAERLGERDVFGFTVVQARAVHALREIGLM